MRFLFEKWHGIIENNVSQKGAIDNTIRIGMIQFMHKDIQ